MAHYNQLDSSNDSILEIQSFFNAGHLNLDISSQFRQVTARLVYYLEIITDQYSGSWLCNKNIVQAMITPLAIYCVLV
jgi:hypothetical protein